MTNKHNVPLHICKGCGKCSYKEKSLEDLIKECVKYPDRFREGLYARPEVIRALEESSREPQNQIKKRQMSS
jgi:hypothetical protein